MAGPQPGRRSHLRLDVRPVPGQRQRRRQRVPVREVRPGLVDCSQLAERRGGQGLRGCVLRSGELPGVRERDRVHPDSADGHPRHDAWAGACAVPRELPGWFRAVLGAAGGCRTVGQRLAGRLVVPAVQRVGRSCSTGRRRLRSTCKLRWTPSKQISFSQGAGAPPPRREACTPASPIRSGEQWLIQVVKKNYLFGQGRKRWAAVVAAPPRLRTVSADLPSVPRWRRPSIRSRTRPGIRGAPVNWIGFENYDEFLFRGLASRDNLAALQRTLIFSVVVTDRPVHPRPDARPVAESEAQGPNVLPDPVLPAR